jgi:hypothetical protein
MTYDTNFVAWTCQQVSLIRALPAGSGIDIENLAEEIEAAGRAAVANVSGSLRQLLTVLARRSQVDAVDHDKISQPRAMAVLQSQHGVHRHIDLERFWRLVTRGIEGVSVTCPWSIEQLIHDHFDINKLLIEIALSHENK